MLLKIDSPRGIDKLLLHGVAGQEAISQRFRSSWAGFSEDDSIAFVSIVGKSVSSYVKVVYGEPRETDSSAAFHRALEMSACPPTMPR
jgi:hypothetical protein